MRKGRLAKLKDFILIDMKKHFTEPLSQDKTLFGSERDNVRTSYKSSTGDKKFQPMVFQPN